MSLKFLTASAIVFAVAFTTGCSERPSPLDPTRLPTESQPLIVSTATSFTQVMLGAFMACGLRNDGVAECWTNDITSASSTFGSSRNPYQSLGGGFHHSCALRSSGMVGCWGNNDGGQSIPKEPANGSFTAVAGGNGHTCALTSTGVIECWGTSSSGAAPATKSAADGIFTAVAAGLDHTCGLRDDGAVQCWGWPGGDWATQRATAGTFTAIAAGGLHTCGLRDDGAVECWGLDASMYVGTFYQSASGKKFTSLSTEEKHSCGLREDGVIECWGTIPGTLGTTWTAPTGKKFTGVAVGPFNSCALRNDGVIQCNGIYNEGTRTPMAAMTHVNPTATFTAPAWVVTGQSIPVSLTNAAVPGHPEATAFTYAFDCGAGYGGGYDEGYGGGYGGGYGDGDGTSTANASTTCPTASPGKLTVKGKVIDKDGDATEYTKTVDVLSSSDAITQLKNAISTASGVSSNLRNPLIVKLSAAQTAIAKNKSDVACTALGDFRDQVTEKRGKGIPVATADAWLETATQIGLPLGCSGAC